jgi:hypothetical protein
MKLIEQFEQLEEFDECKIVEITERFAIHFALWLSYNYIVASDGHYIDCVTLKKSKAKELLEIFKIEYYN